MEPSQAPHEGPAKVVDPVTPSSLSRFKSLAARLFSVEPDAFLIARQKDEAERRAKRDLLYKSSDAKGEPSDEADGRSTS